MDGSTEGSDDITVIRRSRGWSWRLVRGRLRKGRRDLLEDSGIKGLSRRNVDRLRFRVRVRVGVRLRVGVRVGVGVRE